MSNTKYQELNQQKRMMGRTLKRTEVHYQANTYMDVIDESFL